MAGMPPIPAKRFRSHRQTCPRRLGVPRRRIVRFGIERPCDLVQQRDQPAFKRVVLVQMGRDHGGLRRIDHGPAADDVGASLQGAEVPRDPVRRDHGIRVRGQQHAIRRDPLRRQRHRQPSRMSGVGLRLRQVPADHLQPETQVGSHRPDDGLGVVGAVVQQQNDGVR
jgi:hypothetical protein